MTSTGVHGPDTDYARSADSARRPRRRPRYRLRRAIAVVVALGLVFGGVSVAGAAATPGSAPLAVKWVEWLRGHGGAGLVRYAEQVWYSNHPPPTGGRPAASQIPALDRQHTTLTDVRAGHLPAPATVPPAAYPALPGEGVWHPAGRLVHGLPAVYTTWVRADATHTSVVAALAWMDPTLVRAILFAGAQEPGGGGWQYTGPIAAALRPSLVAAFNSGFRLSESNGGYYSQGRTARPLVPGAASIVIYRNGTMTVGAWDQQVSMTPNVVSVRQNLQLIVDNGRPVRGLNSGGTAAWGATLGNALYVWRSGLGVTQNGALVYAAGPYLSAASLAGILARAGAVRAMELDINTDWVNYFIFNQPPGAAASPAYGTKLLPAMVRPPQRYFEGTSRDFIGIFAR